MMETCENCGRQIGNLEIPCVWHNRVVCEECAEKLNTHRIGPIALKSVILVLLLVGAAEIGFIVAHFVGQGSVSQHQQFKATSAVPRTVNVPNSLTLKPAEATPPIASAPEPLTLSPDETKALLAKGTEERRQRIELLSQRSKGKWVNPGGNDFWQTPDDVARELQWDQLHPVCFPILRHLDIGNVGRLNNVIQFSIYSIKASRRNNLNDSQCGTMV